VLGELAVNGVDDAVEVEAFFETVDVAKSLIHRMIAGIGVQDNDKLVALLIPKLARVVVFDAVETIV
jgi:hypothetical protein